MTLLAPKVNELYPIGSIIESNAPPGANWLLCKGQVLAQANYPVLFGLMDNPHPELYSHWNFCDDYDTGGDYPYAEEVHYNENSGSPIWVACGWDGLTSRSTDGITWSLVNMPTAVNYYGPAWNGTIFCATTASTAAATSTDGSSWTARTLSYSYNWYIVVWDGTYFIAVSSNNVQSIKSTDGISWSDAGALPLTGWYKGASDGAGTTVVIDSGSDIAYSVDNGTTWTLTKGATGTWYGITYCNGYFLIGTNRGYVGISADGINWEFRPYASDPNEMTDNYGYSAAQIYRWRWHNGIYFGVATNSDYGLYSFDLKTFHPWFCNPAKSEHYDIVYNSVSDNLTCFGSYGYAMPYTSEIEAYTESTHFQLPNYITKRFHERGRSRYIRVK